ncbi:four helix bundle protein [Fibrobacter sp.]|uniref:four helix bundle protein n=1 Tax=Fibrobacter sp. TaxID=35828 RepID=UPI00388D0C09
MKEELFSYRDLAAYQRSKTLVSEIYGILESFPQKETYALCDQLRRAVISIPSNIAEGMGRVSVKEQIHFIEIAFGSLYEVMCQTELAKDLNYISEAQFKNIEETVRDVAKPLSGLRTKRINLVKGIPEGK